MCLTSLVAIAFFTKEPVKVKAEIPSGQSLDTHVDTLSLSDLTIGGNTGLYYLEYGSRKYTTTFSFSGENTNKNLVFKFKYNVSDDANNDKKNA